VLGELLAVI